STLVLTLLTASAVAGAVLVPRPVTGEAVPTSGGVAPPGPPEVAPIVPPTLPDPGPSPDPPLERPSDVLRGWAQQMSVRTGIPAVALQAYGYAELVVAQTTPGCRLSWTTLAAIGKAESNHGSSGRATLQSDGRAWPEIFGPPLDGKGDRQLVRDTDGGRLDRDPVYDRAVGPMQFLPQTWEQERVDATGEGLTDPHNIHDAALAAANYLCRNGRDLSSPEDWWAAILSYNNVQEYAEEVFAAAHDYGRRSR
ncbi:MAG: transglycosylase SLT domain-containing protein, partial [Micromonosporaceae bacterium]